MSARRNPLHDVAIVGVHNTEQARRLPHHTNESITLAAVRGALADAGLRLADIDGMNVTQGMAYPVAPPDHRWSTYKLFGGRSVWRGEGPPSILGILEAAAAIATGQCHTVLIATGQAGVYTDRAATAPWTRPTNEFVACWGMFTAAEFALLARHHMHEFGTRPEHLAEVASTIRNNGNINPGAVYFGRGEVTPENVLQSRMIADPYHLLDCATTSEGGVGLVLTTAERARDLAQQPVYLLGGANDEQGPAYERAICWDELGWVGERAGRLAFDMAGLRPADVSICEFYDNFSWEIIHQFEIYGFCGKGEGGDFVMNGRIKLDGQYPVTTDGGLMSHAHIGLGQYLQRVVSGVVQLRGQAGARQVRQPTVVLCAHTGLTRRPVLLYGNEPA